MNILYKMTLGIALLLFTTALMADSYQVHRIHKLETIPMKYELAKKVMPVIRTLISTHGHIAHLKGSDNLIIKATPQSISKLREILSTVTLDNFDAKKLRKRAAENLFRKGNKLVTKTIKLQSLQAKDVVAALGGLVSNKGITVIKGTNNLKITDAPDFVDEMIRLIAKLDKA